MKMMMTRLQGVLPGLLSRKLFHSSSYDNALSYDDLLPWSLSPMTNCAWRDQS
jgi:hypothetical protein